MYCNADLFLQPASYFPLAACVVIQFSFDEIHFNVGIYFLMTH